MPPTPSRSLALVFAFACACTAQTRAPDAGGTIRPLESPNPTTTANGSGQPGPPPTGASTPREQPPSSEGSSTPAGSAAAYPDDAGVGAMARSYLRSSPARRLIVEVDWVGGRRPAAATLDHLEAILRREADKPDGVTVEFGNEIPTRRSAYRFSDIARVEDEHRRRHSSGTTATMWLVALDGELDGEPGTIGVALTASSAAIFEDRIDDAATALVRRSAIERSVLTHEVGHLLALVNIGYESAHDHEDADHPHHSRFRDSVMFWQVEDATIASLLEGGPPDDLDRFDRDDLQVLREG